MKILEHVTIAQQFCGPPDSGNGGYSGGLLGRYFDEPFTIRLSAPVPLDTSLNIAEDDESAKTIYLRQDEQVIASASIANSIESEVPPCPNLAETEAAEKHYKGFIKHPFPTCFVCGPDRQLDDAMCLYTGPLQQTHESSTPIVASRWTVDPSYCDESGTLKKEFLCAALDCPSSFGILEHPENLRLVPMVLGTLTVEVSGTLSAGEQAIVIGWPIGSSGRKATGGTAIFNAAGECIAKAKALWISLNKNL